jgi:hypothetical protein
LAEKQYRTVIGIVQFDPKEGEAAGKPVRNIVVRATGFKDQSVKVYATIWPSHASIDVKRNDVVAIEGTYSQGKGQTQDGSPIVYHNLSVTRLAVLGASSEGERVEVENAGGDVADDDDIPF